MRKNATYTHTAQDGNQDYLIQLTYEYSREDKNWIGVCFELGTSAYSVSLDAMIQQLRDAVGLQLSEVERLGYIWEYLNDNHATTHKTGAPTNPEFSLVG